MQMNGIRSRVLTNSIFFAYLLSSFGEAVDLVSDLLVRSNGERRLFIGPEFYFALPFTLVITLLAQVRLE